MREKKYSKVEEEISHHEDLPFDYNNGESTITNKDEQVVTTNDKN